MHAMSIGDKKSWAAKVGAGRERVYGLEYTFPDGRDAYYFILINPPKERAFLKALEGDREFDLKDFGEIIRSGYGKPPAEVKKEMKEKYNVIFSDEEGTKH